MIQITIPPLPEPRQLGEELKAYHRRRKAHVPLPGPGQRLLAQVAPA